MKKGMGRCCEALLFASLLVIFVHPAWAADIQLNGNVSASGNVTAISFTGSGSGLTGIPYSVISSVSVSSTQIADNAVTANKLLASSVTPVKISFYDRVAIVAKSGGDYNNPATAMSFSNVGAWCPSPSSTSPCLLKIMPGFYSLSGETVFMREYIDIEGSGENTTILDGNVNSIYYGTVNGANNSEIRFLTIKNTSSGSDLTIGMYNDSASPKITNVTVSATATGAQNAWAIYNLSSSPVITNVTATASGGTLYNMGMYNYTAAMPVAFNLNVTASGTATNNFGVYNHASSTVMTNLTASSSGGATNYGVRNDSAGTVKINNSVIKGTTRPIHNNGATTYVANTQLDGGAVYNNSVLTCVGAYSASYVALTTSCVTP